MITWTIATPDPSFLAIGCMTDRLTEHLSNITDSTMSFGTPWLVSEVLSKIPLVSDCLVELWLSSSLVFGCQMFDWNLDRTHFLIVLVSDPLSSAIEHLTVLWSNCGTLQHFNFDVKFSSLVVWFTYTHLESLSVVSSKQSSKNLPFIMITPCVVNSLCVVLPIFMKHSLSFDLMIFILQTLQAFFSSPSISILESLHTRLVQKQFKMPRWNAIH